MSKKNIAVNEQVILTEFDNGAGVLVDVERKRYYQLNETSLLIWRGLQQGLSLPQIVQQVMNAYEVDETEITAHATELVQDLRVRQLAIG